MWIFLGPTPVGFLPINFSDHFFQFLPKCDVTVQTFVILRSSQVVIQLLGAFNLYFVKIMWIRSLPLSLCKMNNLNKFHLNHNLFFHLIGTPHRIIDTLFGPFPLLEVRHWTQLLQNSCKSFLPLNVLKFSEWFRMIRMILSSLTRWISPLFLNLGVDTTCISV